MNVERKLISQCVNSGTIKDLVARGIAPRHFHDEVNREVFTTCITHMNKYGTAPTNDVIFFQHPKFKMDAVEENPEYLIEFFVREVQRREAEKSLIDLGERLADLNPEDDIDVLFMQHAERVAQVVPSSRSSKLSEAPSRIELYKKMRAEGRLPGVTLGVPTLDGIVMGVQPHELVVISAASAVGKSTMLLHQALSAYRNGTNKNDKILFITLEMEADAILRKFDVMATNMQYRALRALELGDGDMEKWERWGERVSNAPNDIIIIDDIADCTTERVAAEMLRWKPAATYVDYFGIMTPTRIGSDTATHVGMANMAKAMKRIPRTLKMPLFTAAQTNRSGFKDGVRADNIADTIEIFRSADIMLGLERDEDDDPQTMVVKLVKSRDSHKGHTEMFWDLNKMDFHENEKFAPRQPRQDPAANGYAKESDEPSLATNMFVVGG